MRSALLAVPVMILFLGLTGASAQVNATVSGTVADSTGALIPGADVTATNVGTGISTATITNETGSYSFQSLQPGIYRLTAALPGFQTAVFSDVGLNQGAQLRLNFQLQVGQTAETIEVAVDAEILLAETSASVVDVLPEQEVSRLAAGPPGFRRRRCPAFRCRAGT